LVEQYYGPTTGQQEESLFSQLQQLPHVVVGDQTMVQYDECSLGAVVSPAPTLSDSAGFYQIMLCPRVASELGWRADGRNLFVYRDSNGEVIAKTVCWRDGGEHGREWDNSVHRYGYMLLVRCDEADRIRQYTSCAKVPLAWRTAKGEALNYYRRPCSTTHSKGFAPSRTCA
jgi:hypothetical protein